MENPVYKLGLGDTVIIAVERAFDKLLISKGLKPLPMSTSYCPEWKHRAFDEDLRADLRRQAEEGNPQPPPQVAESNAALDIHVQEEVQHS